MLGLSCWFWLSGRPVLQRLHGSRCGLLELLMPTFYVAVEGVCVGTALAAAIVRADAVQGTCESFGIGFIGMAEPLQCLDLFLGGVKPTAVTHHVQG